MKIAHLGIECKCLGRLAGYSSTQYKVTCNASPDHRSVMIHVEAEGEEEIDMKCSDTPCDWLQFGEEIRAYGEAMKKRDSPSNPEVGKAMYGTHTYDKYGELAAGLRFRIPACGLDTMREEYSKESGEYIEYQDD